MNLGHSISQIMQKESQSSYPVKANLTITSLIKTLGFKASSIDQKLVTQSTPNSIIIKKKAPIRFKTSQSRLTLRATPQSQYKSLSSAKKPRTTFSPHRAETLEQKLIQLVNTLTILKLRGGNMGTREPFLSSSQLLSIPLLADCGLKFRTCMHFLHFLVFWLWHFDFSLVKVPLIFCSLYIWNFGLDLYKQTFLKNLRGDLD